jgi:hypothetical protein
MVTLLQVLAAVAHDIDLPTADARADQRPVAMSLSNKNKAVASVASASPYVSW